MDAVKSTVAKTIRTNNFKYEKQALRIPNQEATLLILIYLSY